MKKIIIPIIILAILLTGCKEKGEIAESHPELYYVRTDCYYEPYYLLDQYSDENGRTVTITADPEIDGEDIDEIEPNTYVALTITNEQYKSIINDAEVFEAVFSLVTVVDLETGKAYTYMIDINEPTVTALRKAAYDSEFSFSMSKEKAVEYVEKYRFLYFKL